MKKFLNSQFSILHSEGGQVILILVLIMTVALAIGISVIQRSISDISTSSKVEQSSRAFSAAEAGIEKAIQQNSAITTSLTLDNNAVVKGVEKNDIPNTNPALEYPPLAKEELAQVWLADPTTLNQAYNFGSFDVYFGGGNSDLPAVEVTVISWDGTKYVSIKRFFDADSTRATTNNFTSATCTGFSMRTNNNAIDSPFRCKVSVTGYPYNDPGVLYVTNAKVILARIRLLYSSISHPIAIAPDASTTERLPIQAKVFTATGTSGTTQRKVQVFMLDKVVPPYFDYAIFSIGQINK